MPHLQSAAHKHCIFISDSCLAWSVEKQVSSMSLLLWGLLVWRTRLEVWHYSREFSMSHTDVDFLIIPLPEQHDNSNDWLLGSWLQQEGRQRTTETTTTTTTQKKEGKGREERKEGCGQSHKVRVMTSLLFSVVRSVGMCSCQWTGRVTGGLAGTDVLTQSTCTWLVAYSLKASGLTCPFFFWKQRSHSFPPTPVWACVRGKCRNLNISHTFKYERTQYPH